MTFFHTNPSISFLFLISLILSSHLHNVSADDSEEGMLSLSLLCIMQFFFFFLSCEECNILLSHFIFKDSNKDFAGLFYFIFLYYKYYYYLRFERMVSYFLSIFRMDTGHIERKKKKETNSFFSFFGFMLENKVSIDFFPFCCIGFQGQGNNALFYLSCPRITYSSFLYV